MPLAKWQLGSGNEAVCTLCGSHNTVYAFPAMLAAGSAYRQEPALEGEASCFDHPNKRALSACRQCGRFVCQLCSVEYGSEVWCPSCVAGRSGQAREANLEPSRTLYDSLALSLPLISLVVWPLTAVAAPATLVIAAARWSRPLSILRRSRWRFVVAIAIAILEIGGWVWGIAYFTSLAGRGKG
jgi:hypothetical protein